jgi:hypothetical protein
MIKVHRHFLTAEAYVIEVWEELTTELYYAFDNLCVCVFMCVCGGGGSTNFTPPPPNATACLLWTSWSSHLGMAGV